MMPQGTNQTNECYYKQKDSTKNYATNYACRNDAY